MWRRSVKWSPLSCLLVVITILFSTSSASFVYPKNSDLENISSRQQNQSNTAPTLVSDSTNYFSSKRRSSNAYRTAQVEPRLFFPFLATPRPSPSYGHNFKGYKPSKAPPAGYPAAKPPLRPYSPQPSRPTPPSHTYGLPKPIGYPASSNYHHEEIYITYPPATSITYPTASNNNPSGSYGAGSPSSYLSKPVTTGTNYLPSLPTFPPSKPNYEVPLSISKPSYVTQNPNYYVSTTSTPYSSPNPTHTLSIGQTNYPGYPASPSGSGGGFYNPPPSSGYPGSSLGTEAPPHKPHYPIPSSSSYPSYPVSSGGTYSASSSVGASQLPIFVFIPKPGHFNVVDQNFKPGNYHKPSGASPSYNYPVTRPPIVPISQYYPTAKPTKPLKPIGVYPLAKPPSTAYGVPKPQQYYSSFQSGSENSGPNYHKNSPTRTDIHLNYQNNDNLLVTTNIQHQPFPADSKPIPLAAQAHPSVFQRGNILQRPVSFQSTYSADTSDFISFPEASFNQNQSWPIGAQSSQVVSVTEYPSAVFNIPSYQDEFRVPIHSNYRKPSANDCGGSWVVLQQPTGGFADPSQLQIEPIYSQSENSQKLNSKFNDQLFRSPNELGVSFLPFPSGINEHFIPGPIPINNSHANTPHIPDFLIFSTTPNPQLSSSTEITNGGEWRKPNSLVSSFSFLPSRPITLERTTELSSTDQSIFSSGIIITSPDGTVDTSVRTLTSTENSLILSLNAINLRDPKNGIDFEQSESPSPFLADISSNFSDENDSKEANNISLVSNNNVGTRGDNISSIEENDKLIRKLRSANLRVISSLINRAGIASLFQDKEYTLLAPSNAAFNKISSSQRQRWATRPDSLREMLLHHVIPSHLNSSSFKNEATPASLAGSHHLRLNIYNATDNRDTITTFNGARVLTTDLRLGKLLVHVLDRVIVPGNFPSHSTILDILNDGGLQASLLGPALSKILSSDSPLTVFVPTTEAFLRTSQDEQRLFLNNETAFHNLLWYHIVPGTYYSEGLEDGQLLSTLHSVGRLRVDVTRQNRKSKLARINGVANVIESDVSASNGVVHFIDLILTDILF